MDSDLCLVVGDSLKAEKELTVSVTEAIPIARDWELLPSASASAEPRSKNLGSGHCGPETSSSGQRLYPEVFYGSPGPPSSQVSGKPQPLSYIPTTEVSALGPPHCTLADHSPVPPPRPSPTLGTALWGSCQGPVSGFLHTASNRAGEVASWRSSLPSIFLPLPSSFLPQPFARPTLAPGATGSAIPFRFLFSSSATWGPKWLPPLRGPCQQMLPPTVDSQLPVVNLGSLPPAPPPARPPPFSVTCGPCSAAPPAWL